MTANENLDFQLDLLDAHRRRLAIRLKQRARVGVAHVSPEVILDIFDVRKEIRRIKDLLSSLGVEVQPDSNDEEVSPSSNPSEKLEISHQMWPDGSVLILVPVRLPNGNALCMSKHPVTNAQYRRYVENTNAPIPKGEHHQGGKWTGPFTPWEDTNFSADNQPVVCVPYIAAIGYCQWVNKLVMQHNRLAATKQEGVPIYRLPKSSTRLPTAHEWDYTAYGTTNPAFSSSWLTRQEEIVHNTFSTEPIDLAGIRTNPFGIADMIGQVWEWTEGDDGLSAAVLGGDEIDPEVRGGAFLDDLFKFRKLPVIPARKLVAYSDTQHSDIGFRIAVEISFGDLSEADKVKVVAFPPFYAE